MSDTQQVESNEDHVEAVEAAVEAQVATDEASGQGVDPAEGSNPTAEVPLEGEPTNESGRGKAPKFGLTKIGAELPEPVIRRGGGGQGGPRGPRMTYHNLLTQIMADPENAGDWFEVATFQSPVGATNALKGITKGNKDEATGEYVKTPIPDGQFEFETRRVLIDPNDEHVLTRAEVDAMREQGVDTNSLPKRSKLLVRWMG